MAQNLPALCKLDVRGRQSDPGVLRCGRQRLGAGGGGAAGAGAAAPGSGNDGSAGAAPVPAVAFGFFGFGFSIFFFATTGLGGGPAGCSSATTGLGSAVAVPELKKSPPDRITCTGTVAGRNLFNV